MDTPPRELPLLCSIVGDGEPHGSLPKECGIPYLEKLVALEPADRVRVLQGATRLDVGSGSAWDRIRERFLQRLDDTAAHEAGHAILSIHHSLETSVELKISDAVRYLPTGAVRRGGMPSPRALAQIGIAGAIATSMRGHIRGGGSLGGYSPDQDHDWDTDISGPDWSCIRPECPAAEGYGHPEDDDGFRELADETRQILRDVWEALEALRGKLVEMFLAEGEVYWMHEDIIGFLGDGMLETAGYHPSRISFGSIRSEQEFLQSIPPFAEVIEAVDKHGKHVAFFMRSKRSCSDIPVTVEVDGDPGELERLAGYVPPDFFRSEVTIQVVKV